MSIIIGILGRPNKLERDIISFSQALITVIIECGAIPLGIIPSNKNINNKLSKGEKKKLYKIINMCDGIILQGGTDIYNYDLDAIKYIDKNNIPVLGICLGMQSLAVSKKGELDFIDNHKRGDITIAHNVNIDKFSKLYSIIKKEKIEVNSRHKEVVKNPGKYKVVGYDDENNIEALEDPNKDFCIGVQWHPEDLFFLNKETKYLFNAFIKSCFKYHNSKNIF